MKLKIIPLLFVLCLSCSNQNMKSILYYSVENRPNIILGKGVGELILNETVRKDVKKILGKGRKTKQIFSFRNDYGTKTIYVYKEIGIELCYSQKCNLSHDTLMSINIVSPCSYKTADGISIGSSRLEVQKSLGEPKTVSFEKLINGFRHEISYNKIKFIFVNKDNKANSEMEDVVEEILLWK